MTTLVSPSLINTASNISFTAANVSLGAVSNLHITGGSSGQLLTTNGAGNLSFTVSIPFGPSNEATDINLIALSQSLIA